MKIEKRANMILQVIETTPPYIILYILLALIFVAIIIGIIFHIVMPKVIFKPKVDNNVRVYTYDYSKKEFTYFDKINIVSQNTFTEKEFLDQFKPSDRYRVQDWLKSISRGKQTSQYIQADIIIKSKNKYVTSMIELTSCNTEACKIHFESHLLPFAIFKPKIEGIFGSKKKNLLPTFEAANEFLTSKEDTFLGAIYFFRVYHLDTKSTINDHETLVEINKEVLDLLLHYCNNYSKIYPYSDIEEVIITTSSFSKIATMEMAYTLSIAIQRYLNYKVPNSNLGVAIGVTLSSFYEKDLQKGIEQACSMADAITSGLVKSQTALFDPQFYERHNQKIKYIEETKTVIKNHTFRVYFTPTVNLEKQCQDFYFLTAIPFGTEIDTFSMLLKISEDIYSGPKTLINELIGIVKRLSRNKEMELALTIPFSLIRQFINCVSLSGTHNLKWIVCFDETDLSTHIDDLQTIQDNLQLLLNKGYKIALNINSVTPLLQSKFNHLFSYFIIGKKFTISMNNDPDQNNLRLIQNEYKAYPGKLVYSHLKDLDDIRICAHYSGEILQCNSFAMPSSIPETISKEVLDDCLKDLTD